MNIQSFDKSAHTLSLQPIAHIQSDFPEKFGIPRQSGLVETLEATIIFESKFRNPDALRGLSDFSHIWLLWGFSANPQRPDCSGSWSPTVRPPRLGGNKRIGVFATRSPFRPNPIGLSAARLNRVELHSEFGPVLHITGADLMDGTPIYDIKPYLPLADCHPEASSGFAAEPSFRRLRVDAPKPLLALIPESKREALLEVLAQDPRPAYQDDSARQYGLLFAGFNIHFTVENGVLTVRDIAPTR